MSTCFNILTVLRMLIQLMMIIRLWEALLSGRIGAMLSLIHIWQERKRVLIKNKRFVSSYMIQIFAHNEFYIFQMVDIWNVKRKVFKCR